MLRGVFRIRRIATVKRKAVSTNSKGVYTPLLNAGTAKNARYKKVKTSVKPPA